MRTKATSSPFYNTNNTSFHHSSHGDIIEEIQGLIRVYRDGHVERSQIVPHVPPSPSPDANHVTSIDLPIDSFTHTWARLYIPNQSQNHRNHQKLPLVIYFHGGGFCVGSAAWSCYHHFLSKLSSTLNSFILSLNYRLAPEHPLPAAYHDGVRALTWLTTTRAARAWTTTTTSNCDFSRIFLAGDSAGGNIAYHVSLASAAADSVKGVILLQPFFGGQKRSPSESSVEEAVGLSVGASDAYWRMALPRGASRDHEWCKPVGGRVVGGGRALVCVAERDILRDRSMELCEGLGRAGVKVECFLSEGVGHAFHVLSKSEVAQIRTTEMMDRIKSFVMPA